MRSAVRQIVPLYRALEECGIAELSTTPYYHPILPLLISTAAAREARPGVQLDGIDFHHPEDADWHIAAAMAAHDRDFGHPPAGLWPAEGGVSQAAVEAMAQHGARWVATDEGILARSLGREPSLAEKHRPWRVDGAPVHGRDRETVAVFFRDRELSDRIGFVYSRWEPKQAAQDVIARLEQIAEQLGGDAERSCVTIILDGENPWEHYPDSGELFLSELYARLSERKKLEPAFLRDVADAPWPSLSRIASGSWIDANFDTWIGAPRKNHAWKGLAAARRKVAVEARGAALPEEFYRAEGSDWFWWLGPGHDTPYEESYENLFRGNLLRGLARLDLEPPPILTEANPVRPSSSYSPPTHLIHPRINGRVGSYYDWIAAGSYRASGGTFHRATRTLSWLRFGFDDEWLYVRLEGKLQPFKVEQELKVVVEFQNPKGFRAELLHTDGVSIAGPSGSARPGRGRFGDVVEIAIPRESLGEPPGSLLEFAASLEVRGEVVDRIPEFGFIATQVPAADFGRENWSV